MHNEVEKESKDGEAKVLGFFCFL